MRDPDHLEEDELQKAFVNTEPVKVKKKCEGKCDGSCKKLQTDDNRLPKRQ